MKNQEENYCHKNKKVGKESSNNVTEYVIYDELFITKIANQDHEIIVLLQIPVPHHIWYTQKET